MDGPDRGDRGCIVGLGIMLALAALAAACWWLMPIVV